MLYKKLNNVPVNFFLAATTFLNLPIFKLARMIIKLARMIMKPAEHISRFLEMSSLPACNIVKFKSQLTSLPRRFSGRSCYRVDGGFLRSAGPHQHPARWPGVDQQRWSETDDVQNDHLIYVTLPMLAGDAAKNSAVPI